MQGGFIMTQLLGIYYLSLPKEVAPADPAEEASQEIICLLKIRITGTVRFELTTFIKSSRFQDERHKPDSTKYPNKLIFYTYLPFGSFLSI